MYSENRLPGLRALLSYVQHQVLLPNLVTFVNKSRPRFTDDTSISALLDWVEILVPPSLTKLDILHEETLLEATVEKYYHVISTTVSRCPNLRYLGYFYSRRPSMRHPGFLSGHTIVPAHLTYLRCHFAVFCPELLRWLEGMAQLNTLELTDLNGFFHAFDGGHISPPSAFSNLECLKLNSPFRLICSQVWQTSLVQHLTRLLVVFGSDRGWSELTISDFFSLLVEKSPGLTELSLEYHKHYRLSVESLQILRHIPLRKLSISGATRKHIGGPHAVRNLIQVWPLLEKLDLCSYEADFEDLRHILPFCSHLSVLRLSIGTSISDLGSSWY